MKKCFIVITLFTFISIDLKAQTINYNYDNLGRITQVKYPGNTINYSYDAAGNRVSIKLCNLQQPDSINGNKFDTTGQITTYSINEVSNATNYNWSLTGGGNITAGQNTTSISVSWNTAGNYTLSITALDDCGDSVSQSKNVSVESPTGIINPDNRFFIKIIPNPSSGEFYLSAKGAINKNITIDAYDMAGQIIYKNQNTIRTNDFNQPLNLKKFANGIYNVRITIDDKVYLRKIVKAN